MFIHLCQVGYTADMTLPRNHAAAIIPNDYKKPPRSDAPFTIPPTRTTFYPGTTPVSTLLRLGGPGPSLLTHGFLFQRELACSDGALYL
jgi:hypothetical protein